MDGEVKVIVQHIHPSPPGQGCVMVALSAVGHLLLLGGMILFMWLTL